MTYQQLEAMRLLAQKLGLEVEWCGRREEDEAWLRVSQGEFREIVLCWFPGREPIMSVSLQTRVPLELAHTALELVALHSALTADLAEAPCSEVAPQTGCCGCVREGEPCDAAKESFSPRSPEVAP